MTLRTVELMKKFKEEREKFFAIEEAYHKSDDETTDTQLFGFNLAKESYHQSAVSVAESLINLV